MLRFSAAFVFAVLSLTSSTSPISSYPIQENTFEVVIDHFNFQPTPEPTFPLRYFSYDVHWNRQSGGPCLFYTGNEDDILQFVNNSGFLFEIAEEFEALVIFAEHRYYGRSNPFGDQHALGSPYNISFLTVEQALSDFNLLNLHIREKWSMPPSSAFVAFGGSYGANLALWSRLKNPNLWAGAIASSATPLKHILRQTNGFSRILTEAYGNVSSHCPDLIRSGWEELFEGVQTEDGRQLVSRSLSLCSSTGRPSMADDIYGWIMNALETMVQYGYPYPTSFYNPLPGYPFRLTCQKMLQNGTALGALRSAAQVYYNYTGQAGDCFDFDSHVLRNAAAYWIRKGSHHSLHKQQLRLEQRVSHDIKLQWDAVERAWGYQTCTEVYQPMPTNGHTDFELPYTPNATEYYEHCRRMWNVTPRPNWEEISFMGADITSGSNIFLTNGQLDPWRAAGIQSLPESVTTSSSSSIVVRVLEGAAHHLDLRASNPLDPKSVTDVRKEERDSIGRWIDQWKLTHGVETSLDVK